MATHQLFAIRRRALIVICALFGFSPVFAGSHDAPANRPAQNNTNAEEVAFQPADPQPADEVEQDISDQPTLDDEISYEDRVLLRRDLDAYSRSSDPDHVQLEERRRMMNKQIQERFFAADRDNDGSLSREEATETLPQIARHFSEVDLNGDEVITINELAVAQAKAVERQRLAETKLAEAREKEAKEADQQAKRKNKQVVTNRKRSL